MPECSYRKKNLLPDYIYDSSDCAYIYIPLFFEEREFGYLALAYEDNRIDFHFRLVQWQSNINQMLQGICEAKSTAMLVDRLENIYMKDALTCLNPFFKALSGSFRHSVLSTLFPPTLLLSVDNLIIGFLTFG